MTEPAAVSRLGHRLLSMARRPAPRASSVACPLCQMNLDLRQHDAAKAHGELPPTPVLYITQLLGLALGLSAKELGLGALTVRADGLLSEKDQKYETTNANATTRASTTVNQLTNCQPRQLSPWAQCWYAAAAWLASRPLWTCRPPAFACIWSKRIRPSAARMARLDKTFPTGDCATCIISPKLVECMRDQNIDVMTMTDVLKLEGEPGNFKATLRRRPRYVDLSKCNACGDCATVCPVEMRSRYEAGMANRKAIDRSFAQASPNAFFITKRDRAACSSGCPIDTSVQAYVALIAAGKFQEAAENIRRDNPLPSICGRVCFHPCAVAVQSRPGGRRPINIRALKRFALDQFPDAAPPRPRRPPASGWRSSAPVRPGLAAAHGLAAGRTCASKCSSRSPCWAACWRWASPTIACPPEVLRHDLAAIESLGVQFHVNTEIGKHELEVGKSEVGIGSFPVHLSSFILHPCPSTRSSWPPGPIKAASWTSPAKIARA